VTSRPPMAATLLLGRAFRSLQDDALIHQGHADNQSYDLVYPFRSHRPVERRLFAAFRRGVPEAS
jgi:hypothetical protein